MWIAPQYRVHLLGTFRSLDAALDEHKANGTKPQAPVYGRIFEQLAEDVAMTGFGRDDIAKAAYLVGQLSTFKRLESLMPKQLGPDEQEAIAQLQNQIDALAQICAKEEQAHANSPQFIQWRSHTTDLMRHYIAAKSEHSNRFRMLSFRSNVMQLDWPGARYNNSGPRRDDIEKFASDADVAVACLQGAIQHINVFGLKQEEPAAPARSARGASRPGITQHIHGNVSQAIATGRATQTVGQIGSSGNSLDEIVKLLQESYELNRRQMEEAFGAAQQLDAEVKEPESRRHWKSIAEWGNTLLGIVGKATDLTEKLAPHLPWLTRLIEQARLHG
ncbi:MAG TPA: hypothetical protein VE077_05680 [Candidatus Methylomirabilis sp.]|nr:hypothetical protein [Candidatus Methylomirabilis sp.]